MDTLTLYHVEPLPDLGMPLLITALTEEQPGEWIGEMHLLLEDGASTVLQAILFPMRVSGNLRPPDKAGQRAILRQELLIQADRRLGLYRQEQGLVASAYLSRMRMSETNRNALVHFWVQSPSGDRLAEIRRQTKSPDLREQLELVMSLPTFRDQAIPARLQ